jgi:hypothetical protein
VFDIDNDSMAERSVWLADATGFPLWDNGLRNIALQ